MAAVAETVEPVLTLAEAAQEIGKSPKTLRAWIRDGAPTVRPGKAGRGNGARVRVSDLMRWRHGMQSGDSLGNVADALFDTIRRDSGLGPPAHRLLGIDERVAAAFALAIFQRIRFALRDADSTATPKAIRELMLIADPLNVSKMSHFGNMESMKLDAEQLARLLAVRGLLSPRGCND